MSNPARIAVFLAALAMTATAGAQIAVDYRLSILEGGVATPDGEVNYALLVDADWWTIHQEPFVVRMTVPEGLEAPLACFGADGEVTFDAATRVLSWKSSMNNEYAAERSCPLIFRVAPHVAPGTVLTFTATLKTGTPDANPANDSASLTAIVLPSSDLAVTASADHERFRAGTEFSYTFTVTNRGPIDARDVMLVDELFEHVTFLSFEQLSGPPANLPMGAIGSRFQTHIPLLPNGAGATFRLRVRANASMESATIHNQVHVRSTSVDLQWQNNEAIVWTYAGPQADLAVQTRRGPVTSGPTVPITVEVTNHGPDTVQNVMLLNTLEDDSVQYDFVDRVQYATVTLSQGTCAAPELTAYIITPPLPPFWTQQCALGPLAPGATATVTLLVNRTTYTGPFQHTSAASPSQNDAVPANNASTVDVGGGRRRAVRR